MKSISLINLAALLFAPLIAVYAAESSKPNMIYILADDLGYGDVQCLGGERSKIATPHMDRLAAGGMIFTEAHSSSAVCTPTRYGILTGRYCWRTRLQHGVMQGYGAPLIAKDRLTVPALLKQHGYATACIGKWHLGMDISEADPMAPVGNSPITRGFDSFFGISASLDHAPHAFIENDKFTEAPTVQKNIGRMGPSAPGFEGEDVLPTLTRKAVEYIATRAKEQTPFFLYLPLTSPHAPIVPTKEWRGKSGLNEYADFVMMTDWAVGEVLSALDKAGAANNTLVILTSDNGCSAKPSNASELEHKGHFPSERRRGYKSDVWDGGHRVPFIARWPDRIKAGSRTDQLTCLNDLLATCAELLGTKLPDNAGEDSVSMLPVLLGTATDPVREAVVHHSISGMFAIRSSDTKLIYGAGSGGWSEGGTDDSIQVYDMRRDVGEKENRQATSPEDVERLTTLMQKYIADGRSTPGKPQTNDAEVQLRKKSRKSKAATE